MTRSNDALPRILSVIPRWAFALAALAFLSAAGGLLYVFRAPLLFRVPLSVFVAFFPALWVLVIGHVNGHARRRGLNAWLWTLVAILTPNALGIIFFYVYVWRLPLQAVCTSCKRPTRAGSQFCASCGARLTAGCSGCGKAVEPADAYCVSCGKAL